MDVEKLFDSVGFTYEYRDEMEQFYRAYFSSEMEMRQFFQRIFENDDVDKTPREMVNQIQRFVTLANDIDLIRPGRDPLRIFFIKTCMEALWSLSGMNKKTFYDIFPSFLSSEGVNYILQNFSILFFEDEIADHIYEVSHTLTICDFFEIIKAVRDMLVHDGNYWEMQFFAHDKDSTWIATLQTDEKILVSYEYQKKSGMFRTYHFETKLQYGEFIHYFVEACITFVLTQLRD